MHFYGQFDPPVDQFIFERYSPDPAIRGVFVECGAFDGVLECSCKFFEEQLGWNGYNLEPVPWIFESLQRNRPATRNLNVALSNKCEDAQFRAVVHPRFGRECTNGSLRHAASHMALLIGAGCTFEDVTVKTITWKRLVSSQRISRVDLLVLDVEGHEPEVIDGMYGCPVLPDIICVEFGHVGLSVITDQLQPLGYVYDVSSHANAYFVKREAPPLSPFRCRTPSIPKQNMEATNSSARES
jgi:FkbM family methyltransferase